MLIVSRFHDYYDRITAFGIDKTVVYQRVESKIEFKYSWQDSKIFATPPECNFEFTKGVSAKATRYIIGFCGKLYPVVEFTVSWVDENNCPQRKTECFYGAQAVKKFLDNMGPRKRSRYYSWREDESLSSDVGLHNFFDTNRWSFLLKNFVKYKVPVFIYGALGENHYNDYLVLNPRLKNFGFYRVVDSFTAFQNIYMYISGVLGIPTNPMVKLSDKELAAKKGHGDRYSFRKLPGEPKRKKKKNE